MSVDTYNAITVVLLFSALGALVIAGVFLIAAVVGWRSPFRKQRLVRFGLSLLAFPVLVGVQQVILWNVFLPSIGQEHKQQRKVLTDASNLVQVGDPAPAFAVTDTRGETFDLGKYQGKLVLVNFFATWCGPCIKELPHIQQLWDEHKGTGKFAVIVIGREETTEKVSAFQAKYLFSFPMAADSDEPVYPRYAKQFIPHTYLVGPDGKICFEVTGFDELEFAKLEQEVARQLQTLR